MGTQYYCKNQKRRQRVKAHSTLNGIDYLEVLDKDAPDGSPRQRTLLVRCLKAVPIGFKADNVLIEGGVRVGSIGVEWAAPAEKAEELYSSDLITEAELDFFSGLSNREDLLVLRTDSRGDFSTYRLRLVRSPADLDPPENFDPRLSEVEFSFKVECPGDFDCKSENVFPPKILPGPNIDYLTKDYSSFRRLMLDRLSIIMPDWKERSPADLGIALVELLAYAGDYLSYHQDAVATEAYLNIARKRVSVRRHARLLDYQMHDGCNSRVWVCFEVNEGGPVPMKRWDESTKFRTRLLTRCTEGTLVDEEEWDELVASKSPKVFEPLHDATFYPAHNRILFYTWGDDLCCLPKGATRATFLNSGLNLTAGDVLIFEELKGSDTGEEADADPAHRHALRLTSIRSKGRDTVSLKFSSVAAALQAHHVASGSFDGTVAVWDLDTGELFRTMEAHAGPVNGVAMSQNDLYVVSGSSDGTIKVWDLRNGSLLRTMEGHTGPVNGVAVSRNNQYVVSGSSDGTVKVWDQDTGELLRTMVIHAGSVNGVAISPNSQYVVSGSSDGTVKVWDLRNGSLLRTMAGHAGPVNGVAVSRNNQYAVSGSSDGTVKVWDLTSGEFLRTMVGHTDAVNGVAVYSNGVISGSSDGTVKVWDLTNGELLRTMEGHAGAVNGVAASPDGRVVSASPDGTLKVWDLSNGELLRTLGTSSGDDLLIDPLTGVPIVEVEWHPEDALPFPLCISKSIDGRRVTDMSCARGNVVLADQGRTCDDESLIPKSAPRVGRYRPRLRRMEITFVTSYEHESALKEPASFAVYQELREALPAVKLTGDGDLWTSQRDLLNSDRFSPEFVVEMEDDGAAHLRFGDDVLGKRPTSGSILKASYRVGNGRAGNVGAESVRHVVLQGGARIKGVRNPLPAEGGTDSEPTLQVQLYAPYAFRRQERAVTEDDYAEVVQLHPEVQKAIATLRWTGSWYTMFVTVDRKGGRRVDAEFERKLIDFLERFRLAGHDIEIDAPRFVPLDIAFTVRVAPGYLRENVKLALLETFSNADLQDGRRGLFHPDNFTFGQPVYLSKLVAAAMKVQGVQWIDTSDQDPHRFHRWGQPSRGEIGDGRITFDRLEIARLDNDPNAPENGKIEFFMEGGL